MDRILRIITCVFLLAILVVQFLILKRMPPTVKEVLSAEGESRRQLMMQAPIIHIPREQ